MRLVDHLAARRQLYGRPLATMPDILLIDIPRAFASPSLPLGRFYPVILETGVEYAEMAAFLEMERRQLVVPDLFDRRTSALHGDNIVFARYAPPRPDWPWLLLCRWPADWAAMVPDSADHFARGAYTTEVFQTLDDLVHAEARLLDAMGSHSPVHLKSFPAVMGSA